MDTGGNARSPELQDTLAALALFADIPAPELDAIAHTLEERYFGEGERILREGFSGSGFFIILEDQVRVGDSAVVNGQGGLVVAQHPTKRPPSAEIGGLKAFRTRRFGETTLTFFRARE